MLFLSLASLCNRIRVLLNFCVAYVSLRQVMDVFSVLHCYHLLCSSSVCIIFILFILLFPCLSSSRPSSRFITFSFCMVAFILLILLFFHPSLSASVGHTRDAGIVFPFHPFHSRALSYCRHILQLCFIYFFSISSAYHFILSCSSYFSFF